MLLENSSKQQNDDFISECLFIIITVFILCFYKRKIFS